ncbi:hypothetical protein SteCoe_36760 [Stentor coeruleus]|uniref:EF-hand domain-containing protein n=1 Tax=Stentor coeruleus TaxID=5963 RepID=A0A1R2APD3_9CILI|nr:hypothetical protein SteCoe_36760 [Stentor coeruleus]
MSNRKTKYFSEAQFKGKERGSSRGKSPDKRGPDDAMTLTEEEIKDIKEAFDLFDSDNSGTIDPKEVNAALASLGSDRSQTIFRLLAGIEELGGSITFDDFLHHINGRLGNRNSREGIERIFDLFDDGRGVIDVKNLTRVARELGESMTEDELLEAIKRVAGEKTEITADDFYKVMTKKVYG